MERVDTPTQQIRGTIYWCRVVSFDASTNPTISFDNGKAFKVQILGGFLAPQLPVAQVVANQIPNQNPGKPFADELSAPIPRIPTLGAGGFVQPWKTIDLTGTVSLEYSESPFEPYPGPPGPVLQLGTADGSAPGSTAVVGMLVWNGTTWDRVREISGVDNVAATGLVSVVGRIFNGVGYDQMRSLGADGASSAGAIFAVNSVFNPATGTWDRLRANNNNPLGDAAALGAGTTNGALQNNFSNKGAAIFVHVNAVGGAGSLTAQLQFSPDNGTTWISLGPASGTLTAAGQSLIIFAYPTNLSQAAGAAVANLTTGSNQTVFLNIPLPRTWRLVYVVAVSATIDIAQACYIN